LVWFVLRPCQHDNDYIFTNLNQLPRTDSRFKAPGLLCWSPIHVLTEVEVKREVKSARFVLSRQYTFTILLSLIPSCFSMLCDLQQSALYWWCRRDTSLPGRLSTLDINLPLLPLPFTVTRSPYSEPSAVIIYARCVRRIQMSTSCLTGLYFISLPAVFVLPIYMKLVRNEIVHKWREWTWADMYRGPITIPIKPRAVKLLLMEYYSQTPAMRRVERYQNNDIEHQMLTPLKALPLSSYALPNLCYRDGGLIIASSAALCKLHR